MDLKAIAKPPSSFERLVVFCDGTWCGPEHYTQTNIQLLAEMAGIDMDAPKGSREVTDTARRLRAKYFNGLTYNHLTHGFGAPVDNLGQLCLEIYRYIAQSYRDGTEIWLFGLGRGAYALRCVVGMINNCGIVKNAELCDLVYQIYTSPRENDRPSSEQSKAFRIRASWDAVMPIKIMVLLDTIGSVGHGCINTGIGSPCPTIWDEVVPSIVEKVFHACSIHDRLPLLQPCLATKADHSITPRIYETWFPGCHYDIGRQHYQIFSRGWLYLVPRLLSGVVEPNHVLSNVVLCWVLQSVAQHFPSQTVFQDVYWQIAFLKKSIRTPTTNTGSGDVCGPSKTVLYAPFGRILTRLPVVSTVLTSIASMLPLRDRRIPDHAANIIGFETSSHSGNEKSLAEMAKVDAHRYPSKTHEAWKTWTNHSATARDKKAISWADDLVVHPTSNKKPLQLEPKQPSPSHLPFSSHSDTSEDQISIASILNAHDSPNPKLQHQRSSSSLYQPTVLTATDDTLMNAVIDENTGLVQDILTQKASELAFDFEWLSELIELGYSVEEVADVLIQEEKERPWLLVSGGNFGKRTLRMAKRLERAKADQ